MKFERTSKGLHRSVKTSIVYQYYYRRLQICDPNQLLSHNNRKNFPFSIVDKFKQNHCVESTKKFQNLEPRTPNFLTFDRNSRYTIDRYKSTFIKSSRTNTSQYIKNILNHSTLTNHLQARSSMTMSNGGFNDNSIIDDTKFGEQNHHNSTLSKNNENCDPILRSTTESLDNCNSDKHVTGANSVTAITDSMRVLNKIDSKTSPPSATQQQPSPLASISLCGDSLIKDRKTAANQQESSSPLTKSTTVIDQDKNQQNLQANNTNQNSKHSGYISQTAKAARPEPLSAESKAMPIRITQAPTSINENRLEANSNPITSVPDFTNTNQSPTNVPESNNQINSQQVQKNMMLDRSSNDQNDVIISQLQQLQSPPPKLASINEDNRDSPISQVSQPTSTTLTSRNRGFLSQLLCCFRPTQPNIYNSNNSKPNNTNSNNNSVTNNIYAKNQSIEKNSNQQNDSPLTANNLNHPQKYSGKFLLPARKASDNRICLVIDLDETLVHSSFKPIENADFVVPVEIYGTLHDVYVLKRPHVDEFLRRVGDLFECVLFTASLAKYADPVANLLDKKEVFKARLFRESCAFYRGNYVKDLSRLGRDLSRVIIVDNSPASYIFHPDNAVSILKHD